MKYKRIRDLILEQITNGTKIKIMIQIKLEVFEKGFKRIRTCCLKNKRGTDFHVPSIAFKLLQK